MPHVSAASAANKCRKCRSAAFALQGCLEQPGLVNSNNGKLVSAHFLPGEAAFTQPGAYAHCARGCKAAFQAPLVAAREGLWSE